MRYLLVDAHSVIFAWEELHALHSRHMEAAREQLIRELTAYQDATGTRVVVVFDGKGARHSSESRPGGVQIFYSGTKGSADHIIERLVAKYGVEHEMMAASNDGLVQQTVSTFGGTAMSVDSLRAELDRAAGDVARELRTLRRK